MAGYTVLLYWERAATLWSASGCSNGEGGKWIAGNVWEKKNKATWLTEVGKIFALKKAQNEKIL